MNLVTRYTLFAIIAMALNLCSQELLLLLYQGSYALYLAILAGTFTGLVSKYLLDKMYIFAFRADHWSEDASRFLAYSVTGVFTTLIFWGFELSFEYLFASKFARYTGAVIGLSIGYFLKYRLDRRYVFISRTT